MEKYIFLNFDGVLNTPKGKFDQKAIGTNRRFLMIQNSLHQYHFENLTGRQQAKSSENSHLIKDLNVLFLCESTVLFFL